MEKINTNQVKIDGYDEPVFLRKLTGLDHAFLLSNIVETTIKDGIEKQVIDTGESVIYWCILGVEKAPFFKEELPQACRKDKLKAIVKSRYDEFANISKQAMLDLVKKCKEFNSVDINRVETIQKK